MITLFDNGVKFCALLNNLFHIQSEEQKSAWEDISRTNTGSYYQWLLTSIERDPYKTQSSIPPIHNLADLIYWSRKDLQAAFPDFFGGGRYTYLEWWFAGNPTKEYDLDPIFTFHLAKSALEALYVCHTQSDENAECARFAQKLLIENSQSQLANNLTSQVGSNIELIGQIRQVQQDISSINSQLLQLAENSSANNEKIESNIVERLNLISTLKAEIDTQTAQLNAQITSLSKIVASSLQKIEIAQMQSKKFFEIAAFQKENIQLRESITPIIEHAIARHGSFQEAFRHYDYLNARINMPMQAEHQSWSKWASKIEWLNKLTQFIKRLRWLGKSLDWQTKLNHDANELMGTLTHIIYMMGHPPVRENSLLGLEKDFGQKTHLAVPELTALLRERLAWQNIDLS